MFYKTKIKIQLIKLNKYNLKKVFIKKYMKILKKSNKKRL